MAPVAAGPRANGASAPAGAAPAAASSNPIDPTAVRHEQVETLRVESDKVKYSDDEINTRFEYGNTHVTKNVKPDGKVEYVAKPVTQTFDFKTKTKVPKTGLMLVGWGGNNGTTLTAMILANRHNVEWRSREGVHTPNYYGSLVRASTFRLGVDPEDGKEIYVPFSNVIPMVHPNDFVLGGWDISAMPIDKAMERSQVVEYDLQRQLAPYTEGLKPLPSVYYPDFIAANQEDRADNVIPGTDKQAHVEQIRNDIRSFKQANGLDQVIVIWTANTERYADLIPGVNDTADNLLKSIKESHDEVSASTVFAVSCILEGVPFVNGAPQNTFVPGALELAERHKAFIGGDDFKTGQTRFKTSLAEMLVGAGIKPLSVASFNHLGNNDGKNLSSQRQFRSKEISKRGVMDDMVDSNHLLYPKGAKHPDHCVIIKYLPAVGDNKVAMDDYYSALTLGGHNRIMVQNICEDSLLAVPIILDLAIMAELMTRITYTEVKEGAKDATMYPIMSFLSYSLKAPLAKPGTEVVNGLHRQRNGTVNFFKLLLGLPPNDDIRLETRLW